jgi:hypothetical protein
MDFLQFLHIVDNDTAIPEGKPGHDPIHKIRPVVDHLNRVFKEAYIPQRDICIDEAMCPFKGRKKFRVYMKDQPTTWGFKFYELCESETGYVFNFEMFCAEPGLSNKPRDVVMRLMTPLLDRGYHLYIDNYYCSPPVCHDLTARSTMVCGTVRANRVGMPRDLTTGTLKKGDVDYRRQGSLVACRWKDKKDVYTLSTMHKPNLQLVQARYELKRKPVPVIEYIQHMAGVDKSDQLIAYFPMRRKSVKWWKKPFFHMMTMVIIQTQIILNKHRSQHGLRKKCLEDVVKDLLIQLPVVNEIPIVHAALGDKACLTGWHFPEFLPATQKEKPYKNCKVCYAKARSRGVSRKEATSRRKQTRVWCPDCGVALCVAPCFQLWHTKKTFWHSGHVKNKCAVWKLK